MSTEHKPVLRRHYTFESESIDSPKMRQRTKTASLLCPSNHKEDQYSDLTLSSIRKKFRVSNLKPFATNSSILDEIKIQINQIQETPQQITHYKTFFNETSISFSDKLGKLIGANMAYTPTSHKKKKRKQRNSQFLIKSQVWDDLEILMEDYKQETHNEKNKKQRTITFLNKKILAKYPLEIQKQSFSKKNRLFRFKKDPRVVKFHQQSTEYRPGPGYKSGLNVEKSDYGIYSRSAKKSFYYNTKQDRCSSELKANLTKKQLQMQKSFYKNYLGSYQQRKTILKNTQNPFIFQ